jgi:KDO2-lipid IV(A) lauroyltransferase
VGDSAPASYGQAGERGAFASDGELWRRLAHFGAAHLPEWWMRYSPPFFGLAAAAFVPDARRAVLANLRRIRGDGTPLRDALEAGQTFANYASCLSEALAYGSKNEGVPELLLPGKHHMTDALADGKGAIIATAHTGGWDVAGPVFGHDHQVDLVMVMERERHPGAGRLNDDARLAGGLSFVHVGEDPLASLPLLRHLRHGAVVAIQIDRAPRSMRAREVRLFGARAKIPEGPVRLAQVTGAPIVPMFCRRLGFRSYMLEVLPALRVARHADEASLDAACQHITDAMADFLRRHPTQWFHFRG